MSELKVIDLGNIRESIEKDEPVYYEYYAKSEADKVIAHQKYKRCLAMAMWCASRAVVLDIDGNEKKSEWYWKWKERWKALARKFKEADDGND